MRMVRIFVALAVIIVLAGCASRPINEPITQTDPNSGYRPYLLLPKRANNDPRHAVRARVLRGRHARRRAVLWRAGGAAAHRIRHRWEASPADRRGGHHHRRIGRQLHRPGLCAARRPAVRRVRRALPQARRAGRPRPARAQSVQLVEVHRRNRRPLRARRRLLRRDPVRRRDLRRPAFEAGTGRRRQRHRHLHRIPAVVLPERFRSAVLGPQQGSPVPRGGHIVRRPRRALGGDVEQLRRHLRLPVPGLGRKAVPRPRDARGRRHAPCSATARCRPSRTARIARTFTSSTAASRTTSECAASWRRWRRSTRAGRSARTSASRQSAGSCSSW